MAELHLSRRAFAEAARVFGAAVSMARSEHGSLRATWSQTAALMDQLRPSDEDRARIRKLFSVVAES